MPLNLYIGSPFYYDASYFYLILPAFLIAIAAQIAVKSAYKKMSRVYSKSGYSGAQAALAVLRYYGITECCVVKTTGTPSG